MKNFSLSVLLVLIMITVFGFYPIAYKGLISETFFFLFVCLTFISGVFSITHSLRNRLATAGFTFFLLGAFAVVKSMNNKIADAAILILMMVYLSVLIALLLKLIFSDNNPNVHRIQGAIAAYIIYALLFSFAFRLVFLVTPDAILFKRFDAGLSAHDPFEFMYFSFEILTTMGYGEIIPVGHFAQSLAMIEALSGVLFPSILIARIVSLTDFFKNK